MNKMPLAGGTGFIGFYTAVEHIKGNYEIVFVDKFSKAKHLRSRDTIKNNNIFVILRGDDENDVIDCFVSIEKLRKINRFDELLEYALKGL